MSQSPRGIALHRSCIGNQWRPHVNRHRTARHGALPIPHPPVQGPLRRGAARGRLQCRLRALAGPALRRRGLHARCRPHARVLAGHALRHRLPAAAGARHGLQAQDQGGRQEALQGQQERPRQARAGQQAPHRHQEDARAHPPPGQARVHGGQDPQERAADARQKVGASISLSLKEGVQVQVTAVLLLCR